MELTDENQNTPFVQPFCSATILWVVTLIALSCPALNGQRLILGQQIAEVQGIDEGRDFGEILSVVPISPHSFVLFDGERHTLALLELHDRSVVFSATSRVLISEPASLILTPGGDVSILDARYGKVKSFTRDEELGWRENSEWYLGLSGISGACVAQGEVFVMGVRGAYETSALVHGYGVDHEYASGFGAPFGEPWVFGAQTYGFGHLLCIGEEQVMLVASEYYPELRAYSLDGDLRWTLELEDFQPIGLFNPTPHSMRYQYPPDSLWNQVVSFFSPAEGLAAIQVERRFGKVGSHVSLATRLINISSGQVMGTQREIPFVFAATGSYLAVGDPQARNNVRFYTYTVSDRE